MANRLTQCEESEDMIVVCLVKGQERYAWNFVASRRDEAIRSTGRMAADPDLSFTWYDVALVAKKMREMT